MAVQLILFVIFLLSINGSCQRNYHNSKLYFKDNNNIDLVLAEDGVNFFALGDWGGIPVYPYSTLVQQTVAYQMSKLARKYQTHFQLGLGDNFYFDGVTDVDDKRFKHTFENVFDYEHLQTPWFMLLGNHDHYGNASAQIQYTAVSKRWIMPDYGYLINIRTNSGATNLLSILIIDTVKLCGNSNDTENQPEFKSTKEKLESDEYLFEIEQTLKNLSNTYIPYILVAGHFPIWSISYHGSTDCLIQKLRPLLFKYKISAYLCGHDHNVQHVRDIASDGISVEHLVSGSSALNNNSTQHIGDLNNKGVFGKQEMKYFWGLPEYDLINGGFILIQAGANNMTIRFMETTNKELYQTVIYPRRL